MAVSHQPRSQLLGSSCTSTKPRSPRKWCGANRRSNHEAIDVSASPAYRTDLKTWRHGLQLSVDTSLDSENFDAKDLASLATNQARGMTYGNIEDSAQTNSEIDNMAFRPASSCSSVSTQYEDVFDRSEELSGEDDLMSVYSLHWQHCDSRDNNNSKKPIEDISEVRLKNEDERRDRLEYAESLLASAWFNVGAECRLSGCSWKVVKSQTTAAHAESIAATSSVPVILLSAPDGEVFDLHERTSHLPWNWNEYVDIRDNAQFYTAETVKKERRKHETYSEYCRRLDSESWWKTRQAETIREMEV